jgi:hypothetical protein
LAWLAFPPLNFEIAPIPQEKTDAASILLRTLQLAMMVAEVLCLRSCTESEHFCARVASRLGWLP